MFLKKTIEWNSALVEAAIYLHQKGELLPDTYVIDTDTLFANAARIRQTAGNNQVHLYFMLKQLGRNPEIARELLRLGYDGAVAVDFREALWMIQNGIQLGHVGHLVQIPKACLEQILSSKPEMVTVYSVEKAREINEVCKKLNLEQKIMLRTVESGDVLYSGQYGGFSLKQLPDAAKEIRKMEHLRISGLTSFPCFLFNSQTGRIEPTQNVKTMCRAKEILMDMGFEIEQMNMPSVTCCASIPEIHRLGGTHGEPGHGLTGTTPLHAVANCEEIPCLVYLTEVSHNWDKKAYCYGGGYYRRSHVRQALVGPLEKGKILGVIPPSAESIDYYFGLDGPAEVSESVVMAFRTQIFVTRSQVALVSGISRGNPQVDGIYTPFGRRVS
jgi:predicted amino acid racemase